MLEQVEFLFDPRAARLFRSHSPIVGNVTSRRIEVSIPSILGGRKLNNVDFLQDYPFIPPELNFYSRDMENLYLDIQYNLD